MGNEDALDDVHRMWHEVGIFFSVHYGNLTDVLIRGTLPPDSWCFGLILCVGSDHLTQPFPAGSVAAVKETVVVLLS